MMYKIFFSFTLLFWVSSLDAGLIAAKEAQSITQDEAKKLYISITTDPKIEKIINAVLDLVNAEVLKRAKTGYFKNAHIEISKEKNNPILQRLNKFGSPLNERIRDEIIRRIQEKGYRVHSEQLYDLMIFDVVWG